MLNKGMIRGMGGMAPQTSSLFKRRMPLPARRFFVQISMTGQAELPMAYRLNKKCLLAALMRIVTPTALTGSKGPVQTDTGKLFINPRMTPDTDLTITFDKQVLFFRLVGSMTGRAFILRRGRMAALPSTTNWCSNLVVCPAPTAPQ